MKDNPLVSIIISNYNYEHFLPEAIESALNQTYPHTEVIVVDDGSTDNSQEIIARYGDRITPVLKENGGQASALNAGFALSRGDIIIFLDADDVLFPQTLERVVEHWGPGIAKVQYRLEAVDSQQAPLGFFFPSQTQRMPSGEVWRLQIERGSYVFPPTSGNAFSRSALSHIFPIPEVDYRISADSYLVTVVPFYGQVISGFP